MRMTSRRAWIAALALFAVVAAACGSSDSGTSGGGGAADSIVVGTTDSLQNSFDPAEAYDLFGANIAFNTAQTLVTYGPNATEPSPLLASKLPDVSADGLT
ncbi:MAG: peptide/nickel transport system substrate-binding protein, partial [Actinomycetota bacterium]|nr:peptide/nickel transport system substrate-binding protein [Actinomycetota bacterium]